MLPVGSVPTGPQHWALPCEIACHGDTKCLIHLATAWVAVKRPFTDSNVLACKFIGRLRMASCQSEISGVICWVSLITLDGGSQPGMDDIAITGIDL